MDSNELAKILLEFGDKHVEEYRDPDIFDCPCCGKTIAAEDVFRSKYAKVRLCWDCCLAENQFSGPKPYSEWFQILELEKFKARNIGEA